MKYQVPQFLDLEDKIIGRLTIKQFFYLISVPLVLYILKFFVTLPYLILFAVIFFPLSLLFAFKKVNGKAFVYAVGSFFRFSLKPQVYIWKRDPEVSHIKPSIIKRVARKRAKAVPPKQQPLTPLKIRLLAMRLDRGELGIKHKT